MIPQTIFFLIDTFTNSKNEVEIGCQTQDGKRFLGIDCKTHDTDWEHLTNHWTSLWHLVLPSINDIEKNDIEFEMEVSVQLYDSVKANYHHWNEFRTWGQVQKFIFRRLYLMTLFSLSSNKNCQCLWWYLWGDLLLVLAQLLILKKF